ncbi:MAG: DUF4249 family protein [Saprospiraceae bacterium]|nr:DUF4249 family protein [Saprospiraceae bacterium]
MNRIIVLIILQSFWVVNGCQKEISFENIKIDYSPQLFVEGILYPGTKPQIYVSNSLPFNHEKVTPQEIFVPDADLILSSSTYSERLVPDSTFDKFRCRWVPYYRGDITILFGEEYHLEINYGDDTYHANTMIDQPAVEIKDVQYTPEFYDIYGGHDGVIIKLNDPEGIKNYYRFQMDRRIDKSRMHAHVLDVLINDCAGEDELFTVTDLGRTIYRDEHLDGREITMYIEVAYEYEKGDSAKIFLQTMDRKSAIFYDELDRQLQSILNPFVEPVFIHSTIDGIIGVFGSAVRSQPFSFVYPQDNP